MELINYDFFTEVEMVDAKPEPYNKHLCGATCEYCDVNDRYCDFYDCNLKTKGNYIARCNKCKKENN